MSLVMITKRKSDLRIYKTVVIKKLFVVMYTHTIWVVFIMRNISRSLRKHFKLLCTYENKKTMEIGI